VKVSEVRAARAGKPLHLTDSGVLVTSPGQAVMGPRAVLLMLHAPNGLTLVRASDLLAPSRFLSDRPYQTELRGRELHVLLEGGQTVSFSMESLKANAPDSHCQVLAKGRVVISRSVFGARGTSAVAKGSCASHRVDWSIESHEAPLALTPTGKRLVTRNPDPQPGRTGHVATIWQRKGMAGVALRRLVLRDLVKLSERLPPPGCQGAACRALPRYAFASGGLLTIYFPWGAEKKLDLTDSGLLRAGQRPTWSFGPKPTPRTGPQQLWMGDPRAKTTLMVYGDLQCPYTGELMQDLRDLLSVQRKGVKVVWTDFPLPFHKEAMPAAMAARSVLAQRGQKAFFGFIDHVFSNRVWISPESLAAWGQGFGAKPERIKGDLAAGNHKAEIDASIALGRQLGVRQTPSLFINGAKAKHAGGFWAIRAQLEPLLGKDLRPLR
jgi:hypothetical protein